MGARIRSFTASGGRAVAIGHPQVEVDRVVTDNTGGAEQLGRHLTGLGHRQVGVLVGVASVSSTVERLTGLRSAVERSEERRVGTECRCGGWTERERAEEKMRE